MAPLNQPSHSPNASIDEAIRNEQATIVRKIGALLGSTVGIGGDILAEMSKLTAYTITRIGHGMYETREAANRGLKGKRYPKGN